MPRVELRGARRRGHPPVVAGIALLLVAFAACGETGSEAARSTTTTGSSSTTTVTTAPPTTGSTTTLPANAPVVDGAGAVLLPPPTAPPITVPPGDPCNVLADWGTDYECASTLAGEGELVWSVETLRQPVPGIRVSVFVLANGIATETLAVDDDTRTEHAAVTAVAGDVDGVPGDELVVGFRTQGSSAFLELDVVSGDGQVVAHRSLDKGRAELTVDGLETWAAQFGPEDDNCCPTTFLSELLTFDGTQWRLAPSQLVPADEVPAGDFP